MSSRFLIFYFRFYKLFSFVFRTFHFENMRIDEALRIYLSEFRLPGEAPLISALLEHFAAHWRVRNIYRYGILFSK